MQGHQPLHVFPARPIFSQPFLNLLLFLRETAPNGAVSGGRGGAAVVMGALVLIERSF